MKLSKAMLRGCKNPECRAPYDPENWSTPTRGANGKVYPNPYCRDCAARNAQRYYQENRRRLSLLKRARRRGDEAAVAVLSRRRPEGNDPVKVCPHCGQPRFKAEFGESRQRPGRTQSWCAKCRSDASTQAAQERRAALRDQAGTFLIAGLGVNGACPVPEAWPGEYVNDLGERRPGWFVRLPTAGDLQGFLTRFPGAVLTWAEDRATLPVLRLLCSLEGIQRSHWWWHFQCQVLPHFFRIPRGMV